MQLPPTSHHYYSTSEHRRIFMAEPQTGGECIVWSFRPLGNGSGFSSTPKLLIIVNRQRHSVNSIFDKGLPISPSKHAGKGLYLSPELEKVTGGPDPTSQTHRLVYASDIDCSRRKASGGVYVKSSSDCIISIIGITTRSIALIGFPLNPTYSASQQ